MALKLGSAVYTYLWDYPLEDAVKRVSDMGIKYVEVMNTPPHVWAREMDKNARDKMRNIFESKNIVLTSLNPTYLDINLASTNPGIREESVRQLKETIELCHDLGAKIAIITAGKRHPLIAPPFEHFWNLVKEGVYELLETCEKLDVIFGLENAWTVIDKAHQMKQMVEEVKHDHLKIVYDIANGHMVESPAPAIELVKDYLVHVHVSDTQSETDTTPARWAHDPVGMGNVEFKAAADILKKINYQGVTILETTYREDPDGGILRSIEKLKEYGWEI